MPARCDRGHSTSAMFPSTPRSYGLGMWIRGLPQPRSTGRKPTQPAAAPPTSIADTPTHSSCSPIAPPRNPPTAVPEATPMPSRPTIPTCITAASSFSTACRPPSKKPLPALALPFPRFLRPPLAALRAAPSSPSTTPAAAAAPIVAICSSSIASSFSIAAWILLRTRPRLIDSLVVMLVAVR